MAKPQVMMLNEALRKGIAVTSPRVGARPAGSVQYVVARLRGGHVRQALRVFPALLQHIRGEGFRGAREAVADEIELLVAGLFRHRVSQWMRRSGASIQPWNGPESSGS